MKYMARVHVLPGGEPQKLKYCWADGEVVETEVRGDRVLVGVFPARHQEGHTVYGGSPLMGSVLQVMHLWGMSQEAAISLMHEDSD